MGHLLGIHKNLRYEDLVRLKAPMKKAAPFITLADHKPAKQPESSTLRRELVPTRQGELFA